MPYFYEQRPMFSAVQFDGTTKSAEEMKKHRIFLGSYVIVVTEFHGTVLEFTRKMSEKIQVKEGEWVIAATRNGQYPEFTVMPDVQFRMKYESVPLVGDKHA